MTNIDAIRIVAQAGIEGADARYDHRGILALVEQVEALEKQLAGTRLALSVVKDALAAERATH